MRVMCITKMLPGQKWVENDKPVPGPNYLDIDEVSGIEVDCDGSGNMGYILERFGGHGYLCECFVEIDEVPMDQLKKINVNELV